MKKTNVVTLDFFTDATVDSISASYTSSVYFNDGYMMLTWVYDDDEIIKNFVIKEIERNRNVVKHGEYVSSISVDGKIICREKNRF